MRHTAAAPLNWNRYTRLWAGQVARPGIARRTYCGASHAASPEDCTADLL